MLGLLWCFGLLIGHTCEQTPGGGERGSAGRTDDVAFSLLPTFSGKRRQGGDETEGARRNVWCAGHEVLEDDRRSFHVQSPDRGQVWADFSKRDG
jgi:hypothetical protein